MSNPGRMRAAIQAAALGAAGLLVLVQLVPYGREHANAPVVKEPAWDRPSTRALAVRACFDCHSNEVSWPWYANVAPISWLVQNHVDEGRRLLNFSEWQRPYEEAGESEETVLDGEMPPGDYLLLHPTARLTAQESKTLAAGLAATVGTSDHGDED